MPELRPNTLLDELMSQPRIVHYIYRHVQPGTPTSHPVGKRFTGDHFDLGRNADAYARLANTRVAISGITYHVHSQAETEPLPDLDQIDQETVEL